MVHANAESIIDVLYHKILAINDVTVFVRNDCSLRFVLPGDATRSMPTVSPDNLDTQPVEIMDALVPPLQPQEITRAFSRGKTSSIPGKS